MKTSLFSYYLPSKLIAQFPAVPRDHSRLFVYDKKTEKVEYDFFYNLKKYLQPGDCLVFNQSKVLPARLIMQKETGGRVEVFLLRDLGKGQWECMIGGKIKLNYELRIMNYGRKSPPSMSSSQKRGSRECKINLNTGGITAYAGMTGKIIEKLVNGNWLIKFNVTGQKFLNFIEKYGSTPLPPYIKIGDSKKIRERYQTIYAKELGSVAAPTAGLHFTKKLLADLKKMNLKTEFVTLHVGLGTFRPVKTKKIEEHEMHAEWANLDKKTCERLNNIKKSGGRIIAIGTTTSRVLEQATDNRGTIKPLNNFINPFFYPGYKFKCINGLITNFHLPESTLMMLVAAFLSQGKNKNFGIKKVRDLYSQAIKKKYRFYSFGDAMLIN